MRDITGTLADRLKSLQQTAANNADPRAIVWINRPTTTLTEGKYLDRQLVGTFSGLTASSVAMRRPIKGADADRVYIGYVASGKGKVKYANTNPTMSKHVWIDAAFSVDAVDISVCFDGEMPSNASGSEFVTDSKPWVFWVTPDGECKGQILGLLGDVMLATGNVTKVSAVRSTWHINESTDFGLVVFMLLGGEIYYRQLIKGEWTDATPVAFGPSVTWIDIAAFRTWDYRTGVQGLTDGGEVYELFTQYQGIARHGSEHIEIRDIASAGALMPIRYIDAKSQDENIRIAAVASEPPLYGGLYASGAPSIVRAYNVEDEDEDWGKIAVFVFDKHLVAADVAAQPGAFSIVDSQNVSYVAQSASLGADGLTVTLTFINFNNAKGTCKATYTPGTVKSMADVELAATDYSWTPENLVPSALPVPEVESITNVGYETTGIRRVRFYSTNGQTLLHTEYVALGGDAQYGTEEVWAATVNTGTVAVGITENITANVDVFLARWTVNYYSYDGIAILYTEYVLDGEDATWGASKEWATSVEGEAVANILSSVSANLNVYSTEAHEILYYWDFTESLTDRIEGKTISIPSRMNRDSSGLHMTGSNECTLLNNDIALTDKTIEVTFTGFVLATSNYCGILFISDDSGLIYTNDRRNWSTYFNGWTANISNAERNVFANSKLQVYIDSQRRWHIYKDGVPFASATPTMQTSTFLQLGDSRTTGMTTGTTVTSIIVYDGNILG